jgi:hypothetical protein
MQDKRELLWKIIREYKGWSIVLRMLREAKELNNCVNGVAFTSEHLDRVISKVVKTKYKRVRRLRETAGKAFKRVDDVKKLLDIDTWHQPRFKALTNEAADFMGDGLKVRRHTHTHTRHRFHPPIFF